MELYLQRATIKNLGKKYVADIYRLAELNYYYIDSVIIKGETLLSGKNDKLWTRVHLVNNSWYVMSRWSLEYEEKLLGGDKNEEI